MSPRRIADLATRSNRNDSDNDFTIPIAVLSLIAAIVAITMAFAANQSSDTSLTNASTSSSVVPRPAAEPTRAHDVVATRFDPATKPVAAGAKVFNLTTAEKRVKIGDKVYDLWTFNGTAPGPVLRAVVGDKITINVHNASSSKMLHSVDFHASRLTMGGGHVQVAPGKTGSFSFTAEYPGVFMYHCATPPVVEHIGRGMYGMIIVQPKQGFGKPMPEYAIVQSELYKDSATMLSGKPDAMVFNGLPSQYATEPINLKPNTEARIFFLNAGPSENSSFHVVGTVFDRVFEDGNPANVSVGRQALAVPASGGAVFEMKFVGEGKFPFVTHQFDHVAKGAVGMFVTGDGELGDAKPAATTTKMAH